MFNWRRQSYPPGWTLLHTLKGHTGKINRMKWSPDGQKIITPSDDGTIKIWDAASGKEIHTLPIKEQLILPLKKYFIFDVAVTPDGQQVVVPAPPGLEFWDIDTGVKISFIIGQATVEGVAITPDGKTIITNAYDGTLHFWDFASGKYIRSVETYLNPGNVMVEITPDGRFVISHLRDKVLNIWWIPSGREFRSLQGLGAFLLGFTVTPDGKRVIAGATDKRIYIWDLATGAFERVLEGHTESVAGVSTSHDGRFLISKGHNESIRLWRCEDWQLLSVLKEDKKSTYIRSTPLFHPKRNDILATYGEKDHREIRIWKLDYDIILRHTD
jgi:WD40 repeat protein